MGIFVPWDPISFVVLLIEFYDPTKRIFCLKFKSAKQLYWKDKISDRVHLKLDEL